MSGWCSVSHVDITFYDRLGPQPQVTPPLVSAVLADNVAEIKTLIKSGHSVNITDDDRHTPLQIALLHDKAQAFDYLLTLTEVSLDATNYNGDTALHLACAAAHLPLHYIRQLLEKGADCNTRNHREESPLLVAISGHEDPSVISRLMQHGSRIEDRNWRGESGLHLACNRRRVDFVAALLYWGADPWVWDHMDRLPFDCAAQRYDPGIVELLFPYYFDCYRTVELRLSSVTMLLLNTSPILQDLLSQGALCVAYDDDELSDLEDNLFALDPEWLLELSRGLLHQVLVILFQLKRPALVNMFVRHYVRFEPSELLSNLTLLLSDPHLAPIVVENANKHSKKCSPIAVFTESASRVKMSPSDVFGAIFSMLSHGIDLTVHDLFSVYLHYGYSDMFHCLLSMDITGDDMDPDFSEAESLMPGLYFNLKHDVEYYMSRGKFIPLYHWNWRKEKLKLNQRVGLVRELLRYFVDWRLCNFVLGNFTNKDVVRVAKQRRIPSLVEMSRNKAREHVLRVFAVKSTRHYFTIVENLPLAKLHKDILLFKKPIYSLD